MKLHLWNLFHWNNQRFLLLFCFLRSSVISDASEWDVNFYNFSLLFRLRHHKNTFFMTSVGDFQLISLVNCSRSASLPPAKSYACTNLTKPAGCQHSAQSTIFGLHPCPGLGHYRSHHHTSTVILFGLASRPMLCLRHILRLTFVQRSEKWRAMRPIFFWKSQFPSGF